MNTFAFFGLGDFASWIQGILAATLVMWSFAMFVFWGAVLVLFWSCAKRDTYYPIGILAGTLFGLFALTGVVHPVTYYQSNPNWFWIWVASYIGIFLVWMSFRSFRYLEKNVRAGRLGVNIAFLAKHGDDPSDYEALAAKTKSSFDRAEVAQWIASVIAGRPYEEPKWLYDELDKEYSRDRKNLGTPSQATTWSDHGWDFVAYGFYWWIDIPVYIFGELLSDVFEFLAKRFRKIFDKIFEKRAYARIDPAEIKKQRR